MAEINFNANEVDPSLGREPIPAGEYVAAIAKSEWRTTNAGTGQYLQMEWEIMEGAHQGRKFWTRLNLKNPNPTAVLIAQGELSAICHACGVMTPRDSSELHDMPCKVQLKVTRDQNGELTQNELAKIWPMNSGAAPAATSTTRQDQSPQAAGGQAPPWGR